VDPFYPGIQSIVWAYHDFSFALLDATNWYLNAPSFLVIGAYYQSLTKLGRRQDRRRSVGYTTDPRLDYVEITIDAIFVANLRAGIESPFKDRRK
jgi:hypothetical protein